MHITDPIADMLTRIRNATSAKHETVDVPASNMKKSIAQILLDEGYIKSFQLIDDGTQGVIRITLKYNAGKHAVISGLRRVSTTTTPASWTAWLPGFRTRASPSTPVSARVTPSWAWWGTPPSWTST